MSKRKAMTALFRMRVNPMTDNLMQWEGHQHIVDLALERPDALAFAHDVRVNTAVTAASMTTQLATQHDAQTAPSRLDAGTVIDETRVAAQFSRAASRYQQGSGLQQRCAAQLLRMLTAPIKATADGGFRAQNSDQKLCAQPFAPAFAQSSSQSSAQSLGQSSALPPAQSQERHLLDLGAGPGWVHTQLQQECQPSRFYALDLSAAMLAEAKKQGVATDYIQADASAIPLPDAAVDLIFSNLMLQWCPAPLQVIAQCWRVLKPGGRAVFSSLVDGSMWQLQQAFADAKQPLSLLSCPPLAYWQQSLAAWDRESYAMSNLATSTVAAQDRAKCWLVPETFYAADVRGVLQHFKQIGANYVPNRQQKGLQGRGWLTQLQKSYEHHRTPQGLPLTFNVVYIQLEKPVATA